MRSESNISMEFEDGSKGVLIPTSETQAGSLLGTAGLFGGRITLEVAVHEGVERTVLKGSDRDLGMMYVLNDNFHYKL